VAFVLGSTAELSMNILPTLNFSTFYPTPNAKRKTVVGDFRRANSSLFNNRKKFETVIKTIVTQ
jgi:hypothetical protein